MDSQLQSLATVLYKTVLYNCYYLFQLFEGMIMSSGPGLRVGAGES